jgi:hypothetical protein
VLAVAVAVLVLRGDLRRLAALARPAVAAAAQARPATSS